MLKQMTFKKIINIIWFSVALTFCWPLSANSTKIQIFVFRILQIISIINAFILLLPLLYSVYLHFDDIVIVFKSIALCVGLSQMIIQTAICFVKYNTLQVSFYIILFLQNFFILKLLITLYSNFFSPVILMLLILKYRLEISYIFIELYL